MAGADPIQTARRLAATHPQAKLPCPVCVNAVKATNLDGHLAKVHPGATSAMSPWRGTDRRIVIWATAATLLGMAIAMIAIGSGSIRHGTGAAYALLAGFLAPLLVAVAGLASVWGGTLAIDGDVIVLRHSFGLGRRRIRLPCTIESGPLFVSRSTSVTATYDMNHPSKDVRVGSYLRLANGRRGITIASTGDSPFRETWNRAGWTAGKRRHWCDVKVRRDVLVAIEYELAARGMLVPR
ncbi:MAG: hypothetical protein HOW73_17525 [Polyangiaceae bacterium]|nr:hypothetical protein [Polyangiaceae bacterium]